MSPKIIDVVVGVLRNAQGEYLFTQRPAGKPMAGYWEFPGGKVETGESHQQALVRELQEELGITITNGKPWRTVEHVYPHAHVLLHFIVVTAWQGEPHGRELQALHWQKLSVLAEGFVSTPETEPILPATVPLLTELAQLKNT
jgi:8-oxo-dGTP diphosphatase